MIIDQAHDPYVEIEQQAKSYQAGMWVFLSSEIMLFGTLILIYTFCRWTYASAFAVVGAETDKPLGTINTLVLLTSSFAMAVAVRRPRLTWLLLITACLGTLFVFFKASEWASDIHKGFLPGAGFHWSKPGATPREAELFFFLYFVLTGIHMVHLSIGIGVILTLAFLSKRGRNVNQEIELGGLYWHFVDLVWVFLYPMFYLIPIR